MSTSKSFISRSIFRQLGLILLATITLALGACASGVKLDDVDGAKNKNGAGGNGEFSNQPWNDPSSPIYKKSVYFDFDSYVVKSADQSILAAHANYLKANKNQKSSYKLEQRIRCFFS